jgi:hypothetical protein
MLHHSTESKYSAPRCNTVQDNCNTVRQRNRVGTQYNAFQQSTTSRNTNHAFATQCNMPQRSASAFEPIAQSITASPAEEPEQHGCERTDHSSDLRSQSAACARACRCACWCGCAYGDSQAEQVGGDWLRPTGAGEAEHLPTARPPAASCTGTGTVLQRYQPRCAV